MVSVSEVDTAPIDVERIRKAVDSTWAMKLSTSTRDAINSATAEIIGYVIQLQGQPLGEDTNTTTAHMLRLAERQLSAEIRPDRRAPVHDAFGYLKDTTVVLSSLLSLYEQIHGRES